MKWAIQDTVLIVWIILELNKFHNLYGHDQVNIVHFTTMVSQFIYRVFICTLLLIFSKGIFVLSFWFEFKVVWTCFDQWRSRSMITLLSITSPGHLDFELPQVDQSKILNSNHNYCWSFLFQNFCFDKLGAIQTPSALVMLLKAMWSWTLIIKNQNKSKPLWIGITTKLKCLLMHI